MNACTECPFYVLDVAAKAEGEAMDAAYEATLTADQRAAYEEWAAQAPDDAVDPFAGCGPYCTHIRQGKGFPGEYVYSCDAPGNEHVIYVDFNESEII